MTCGVLSIQGDFAMHIDALRRANADIEITAVKTPEGLAEVDRLIIPGGESTTVGMLLARFGLDQAIRDRVASGMPIWGTCMGMILLAKEIEGSSQPNLGVLDITVRRNAFGAQVHSFEDQVCVDGIADDHLAVFIRAPIVTRSGAGVDIIAKYDDKVVGVRAGNVLATSFHPELTEDVRLHQFFLSL